MDTAINPVASPSPEHLAQLDAARESAKKLRRVVAVANFDGWAIAVFAAISLVFSITSPSGILLSLGMGYVAWRELSSGADLRRLEPDALRRLTINQLVFCGILVLYFAWCLYQSLTSPLEPEEIELGLSQDMMHTAYTLSYVGLMVASALFQGGTAWYYSSRAKLLENYLATTPQWIIDYQRGGGTL